MAFYFSMNASRNLCTLIKSDCSIRQRSGRSLRVARAFFCKGGKVEFRHSHVEASGSSSSSSGSIPAVTLIDLCCRQEGRPAEIDSVLQLTSYNVHVGVLVRGRCATLKIVFVFLLQRYFALLTLICQLAPKTISELICVVSIVTFDIGLS